MITKLHLENFRGIAKADLDIAPVTVLTGANNTGKSTVPYGLLALKNIVSNPNQPLDSFFNFIFMNLGGFKETIHLKEEDTRRITIGVESQTAHTLSTYAVELGKAQSTIRLTARKPAPFDLHLDVTFPYAVNLSTGTALGEEFAEAKITWNGISGNISVEKSGEEEIAKHIAAGIMGPVEDIKGIDLVPLKRGFGKPAFSPVPLQPQLTNEDEIATLIANDRDLEAAVGLYLERIVNKNFQIRPVLGIASFYLETRDRTTGFLCDLVNDGFGTNQLVYLLAKSLWKGQSTVCIEEPEIHLHPGAVLKLVEVLADIAKQKGRNFVITTHSEHVVLSLLSKLAHKALDPADVRIYHVRKDGAQAVIEEQQVTEKGQIVGGLKAFYETELDQMHQFLGVGSAE